MKSHAGFQPCLADCLQGLRPRDILLRLELPLWGLGITYLHITQVTVLSLRAKASSYLYEHGSFDLFWALPSSRALVCSPAVPLSTPPTGSFYLKTQAHTQVNILPLPGFSHPPPHLVHTPDLTSSDPHGKSQARLCSASLRPWWDPPSFSQIPSLVDASY